MIKIILTLASLSLLVGGFVTVSYAQKTAPSPAIEMIDDTVISKLAKAEEPLEQHDMLRPLTGTWNYTLKYYAEEGADPQISSGTMINDMVLGNRFLSSKTVIVINAGGQTIPYEGWGILGYDSTAKAFTSIWVDTMHTAIINGVGKYSDESRTITQRGKFTHPLLGKEQSYRSEIQFIDDNAYRQSIFITDKSGQEFEIIHLEFNRL